MKQPVGETRTVWVVNRSSHDFSPAARFGVLRFLSKGLLRKRNVNFMVRQFTEALAESKKEDYILPTSMSVMTAIATSLFALKHGQLNLLIYENGSYCARTVLFTPEEGEKGEPNV